MGFQQALSGLNAADKNLQVIGNNVSNSNTVGFKSSTALFADVFANSLAGGGNSSVGSGTSLSAVAGNLSQGNLTTTNNPLDLAIQGQGFFRMSNNGSISYSRNGQFMLDKNNFIVDSTGRNLTGFTAVNGAVVPGAITNLQIPSANLAPKATANVTVGANLSSASTVPAVSPFNTADPNTYNFSTPQTIYDSLGQSHSAMFYFVRSTTPNIWNAYTYVDGASADPLQTTATQYAAAQANASASAASLGATTAQINAITGAMISGTTSAQMASAASTAATGAGLTAAQASTIAAAVSTVPDVLAPVQTAATQLSAAQSLASAAATGFGATTAQAGTISGSMVSGTTSAQMATAASTAATAAGLTAAQSTAISSLVNLVHGVGSVQTAANQLTNAQNSATAMATAFGATAAQITAITGSLVSGTTSAQMATAASTAATTAGLTAAQAAAISSVVGLVPNPATASLVRTPTMLSFSTGGALVPPASNTSKSITLTNGAAPLAFAMDFSKMTQYGTNSAPNTLTQDGYTSGQLNGYSFATDGTLSGRYSNGQSLVLGQVILTNFANAQGLKPLGSNQFAETSSSGSPLNSTPGASSFGTLQSSAVESSNVDLTAELVNMIVAQRAYQANAQTIKTEDQIMQTIVSLR